MSIGLHTLYVRVRDNSGYWGIVRQVIFEVYAPITIAGAEYFIDEDPGPGNGTPLPAKDRIFDSCEEDVEIPCINVYDLSDGQHTLNVRFRNSLGLWGSARSQQFICFSLQEDADEDGMPNGWESSHGLDPFDSSDAAEDVDSDGLTNLEEYGYHTDPNNPDSDSDSLNDGEELIMWGTDWDKDLDNDGLINILDPDSDGDGFNDGFEARNGFDPKNSQDHPSLQTLYGVLRDAVTNKALSSITITIDGIHTNVTDENGHYEFFNLSSGVHTVVVDVPSGYSQYVRTVETPENPTWNIFLTRPQTVYGGDTSSGYGPDPVNTATGNYIYNRKDVEIPGKGMAFVFYRYYNSQDGEDGPLGFGWGHTYSTVLTVNADSSVTIQRGDGKTETWTPNGSGLFMPQHGIFDTLIENSDGSYTLKKKDLTRYAFDTSGRLSNITDKNGNRIDLTYTGSYLTQITDTAGRNLDLSYDENGHITQVADPIGRELRFAYADGDLVSATDMNGNVTAYTYDDNHQMITVIDPRENIVVTNTYDVRRRVVTSQSDAKGGQTTYLYDEVNKKASITDPLGNTCYHYHDELLRLIRDEDALGNSSYYSYDFAGNRTEVVDRNGNATTYTYDSRGNVLTKTDALGNVTAITYDSNNNPLTRTDALGNVAAFEYDAKGNLKKAIDPLGNFITTTYNSNGQPVIVKDKKDNAIAYAYDAEGNFAEVKNALEKKTTYTYDGAGRRITATDSLDRTTSYIYDNNNNLLSVTDPLGNITSNIYDANDNRITNADLLGNITRYTYDIKDLLETIVDPLGNAISYSYDGLDRKISYPIQIPW